MASNEFPDAVVGKTARRRSDPSRKETRNPRFTANPFPRPEPEDTARATAESRGFVAESRGLCMGPL